MKKIYTNWSHYFLGLLLIAIVPLCTNGQELMQSGKLNFFNFSTEKNADLNELARFSNAQSHPEYGTLPFNAPCDDCIEIIEERTQYTRKFIVIGTDGREIKIQKGYSPLHYKDQQGNWITYNPNLKPLGNNKFGIVNDYYKIEIDPNLGSIFFENYNQSFEPISYHKNLRLEKLDANGNVTNTLNANWSAYQAGDNGMLITDIFPGVNLEIYVFRDNIKTNFIVQQDIGDFRIVEDLDQNYLDRIDNTNGPLQFIELEDNGVPQYLIGNIKIFGEGAADRQFIEGNYTIDGNKLYYNWDFNDFQNLNYPVKVDPTVTSAGTLPQGSIIGAGTFANNGAFTTGCLYNLSVPTPANCQITDIDWTFAYVAQNGATMSEGACRFHYAACVSPATAGFFWFCNDPVFGGTCTGTNVSIFGDFSACIPPPQCAPYNMDFQMEFYDAFGAFNALNCDPTFITAGSDWTMTITGETVDEPNPPTSTAPGNTICEGTSTDLSATAVFGVPPYTYNWDNGGGAGNPVTVSPTTTTTYTCTITDNCGVTASNSITITVEPAPDAGVDANVSYCASDPITSLLAELGGTPDATGSWTGPSALTGGSAGNFNPATMNAGVYTYTVNGNPPCTNVSATVTVTLDPAPDAGTNGATSFCPSDPSADLFGFLGGTPDAGGTWAPAMASGTGVFNPAVDPAGTYTYTVTNPCGSVSADVVVTMDPAPDAGTNGATSFCPSDPSADLFGFLGGTPDAGGTWAPAMASGTGVFNPAVDPAGTYTYTVTNGCGSISADVVVTIDVAPDPGTNGATSFCPSDPSADLFGFLGGTPDAGGTWAPAMASGTGVFNPSVDPAGTYTYTVTNGCGSASADVVVTMNAAPDAGTNGATSFCPSDPSADLFGFLGGTPDAGGTWAPAMASGTGVFNPAVDPAGTYTYTVTNGCGSISADVVVTIDPAPDAGTNGATSFCSSDPSADLFGFLGGTPDAGGTWAPAMTSGTGVFDPSVDPAGTYTYTVTNSCGSISADVVVTLNPAPDPGTNGGLTICTSDPATDLFNELGGTPDAGGTWAPAMSSGTGVFDPALDPSGTYTYTVTNGCGSASADVVVTIVNVPTAGTNGATSFCPSDAPADLVTFLGGAPDPGGTWAPALTSGTGVFDPSVDAAGTYTYTVTASCGTASADVVVTLDPAPNAGTNGSITLCDTDPATDLFNSLGGTPDAGGTWSPALTSGTGVFDPSIDLAGTYTYSVTTVCGTATADVVVNVTNNPDAGTNGAASFCASDAPVDLFTFLGGTPDVGGTWSPAMASGSGVFDPSIDAAGTYTYTLNACGGGTISADVVVTIDPSPSAGTSGGITICNNDPATDLFNSLGGTPDAGGTWTPTLTSGTGSFDPTLDSAGTYTYTVTNPCGTATADVVVVVDDCSPPTAIIGMSDSIICVGDCIDFMDMSTGNPTSWHWDFGGAFDPDTSILQNPTICPDTIGTFIVTLTATNGNGSTSTTSTIQIQTAPLIQVFGDTIVEMGGTGYLTSLALPSGGTYEWSDDEDGASINCITCPDIEGSPTLTTDYILTYTSPAGCSNTDTATIYVNITDMVGVPNGFSPNGDGENDALFVLGRGIKAMNFTVYNRYGQQVFFTDDQNIGWDGTFLGKPENPGVFVWYLEYTLIDNSTNVLKGNVTLIK